MRPEAPSHLQESWLIIVNPAAGSGLGRSAALAAGIMSSLAPHLARTTAWWKVRRRGHATELAIQEGIRKGGSALHPGSRG